MCGMRRTFSRAWCTTEESDGRPPRDDLVVSRITTPVAHNSEIAVLRVAGEIDLATAPTLEAAIDAVLADMLNALVIDLSAVEFLASVGLRLLIAANEQAEIPGRFAVVADNPATRKPIQLTDLDKIFAVFPTLDDAVRSLGDDASSLP